MKICGFLSKPIDFNWGQMTDINEMTSTMIAELPPYGFGALVAARKSGKSFLLSHIIESVCKKRKYAAAFVISK